MEQSIFDSTKKILGISPEDDSFDQDVLTFINSAFSTLNQLGAGAPEGFYIEDESVTWENYVSEWPELVPQTGQIRTYIFLKVRLLFDPPQTSFLLRAMEKQVEEHEFRLSIAREEARWTPPPSVEIDPELEVIEGGGAFEGG